MSQGRMYATLFSNAQRELLTLAMRVERAGFWIGESAPIQCVISYSFSLRAHLMAADGEFSFGEYEFLKEIFDDDDSYLEEKSLIESHVQRNPDFFKQLPEFITAAAEYDQDNGTNVAAQMVGFIHAMCIAVTQADGVTTEDENSVVLMYIHTLQAVLRISEVPDNIDFESVILAKLTGKTSLSSAGGEDPADWNEDAWDDESEDGPFEQRTMYAVYSGSGDKLHGGFVSEAVAQAWIRENPIFDLYDGEEELVETDFISNSAAAAWADDRGMKRFSVRVRPISHLDVYRDFDSKPGALEGSARTTSDSKRYNAPTGVGREPLATGSINNVNAGQGVELYPDAVSGGLEEDGSPILSPLSECRIRGRYMEVKLNRFLYGMKTTDGEMWFLVQATWHNRWDYRLRTYSEVTLVDSEGFQHSESLVWLDQDKFLSRDVQATLPTRLKAPESTLESGAKTRGWIGFKELEPGVMPKSLSLEVRVFEPGATSGWVKDREVIHFRFDSLRPAKFGE